MAEDARALLRKFALAILSTWFAPDKVIKGSTVSSAAIMKKNLLMKHGCGQVATPLTSDHKVNNYYILITSIVGFVSTKSGQSMA